jgi:hypothetical protein
MIAACFDCAEASSGVIATFRLPSGCGGAISAARRLRQERTALVATNPEDLVRGLERLVDPLLDALELLHGGDDA